MANVKNLKAEERRRKQINLAAGNFLSDQEEGDNYDAYLKLLAASETGQDDQLADCFVNVWEPLAPRMTVAKMIQLIEDGITEPEMPELYKGIDWALLKKQKASLLHLIDEDEYKISFEDGQALEGILTLIDSIQDDAVDNFDVDENLVFDLHPDE